MNLRQFLRCARGPVRVVDTTPDAFSFTTQTGVALDTAVVSDWITVGGIEAPAVITVIGGEYEIEGSSPTSSPGTVENGQRVRVHHTSAASYAGETITTLIIGGVSAEFHSVTGADPAGAWASPTASISFGKLTRVGYGGRDEIGYQGAGSVTISGTNSSHWQWSTNCVVPKNGSGASGTAWVASPSDTYTLTLTDTATGETCTLTVTTDADAADVSSYAQGVATSNALSAGKTIYWAAGFHQGNTSTRFTGTSSFTGSNWKVHTVRGDPYSATIANISLSLTGFSWALKFLNLNLEDHDLTTSGTTATGAIVPQGSSTNSNKDLWIENCNFIGAARKAAGHEPRGVNGAVRNLTIKNCVATDVSYVAGKVLGENLLIDGLNASRFANDIIQVQYDEHCSTMNATIRNVCVYDVDVPAGSGAHTDFIQIISYGDTAGVTLSGTLTIEKCIYALGTGLYECNFLFGPGSTATNPVTLDTVVIKNVVAIGINANNPGLTSKINNVTIDRMLSTRDINNSRSTQASNMNVSSTVVNATVTNCIGNIITLNNTGTLTQSNNLTSKDTATEQTDIFANPYVATGGTALHGDWSTNELMLADISARYKTIAGVTAGPFDSTGAWAA